MADWANIEASVARRRATRVAELLYCNTENTTTVVNCLKKMSTSAIIEATNDLTKEVSCRSVTKNGCPPVNTLKRPFSLHKQTETPPYDNKFFNSPTNCPRNLFFNKVENFVY